MRRIEFSIVCVAILNLVACQQKFLPQQDGADAMGGVEIALSAVDRTRLTKSTTENLPDVADFTVAVLTSDGSKRLCESAYSDIAGNTVYLNAGDYCLYAFCGDSLGVGFDDAFFAAKVPFTVEQQKTATVSAVAKLANVKVAVVFGENIHNDYDSFYALVRAREDENLELTFAQDETRAGYLPAGNLTFEFYAMVDGSLKSYSYDAGDFEPNDFITFNVDTRHDAGTLSMNVANDDVPDIDGEDIAAHAGRVLRIDGLTLQNIN